MEATEEQHEEPPQDEPMQRVVDMPDFGDLDINDEYTDSEEVLVRRSNEVLNSTVYEHFAFEEEPEARGAGQFVATPAMARFLHNVLGREKMDEMLEVDQEVKRRRQEKEIPFVGTEVKEGKRYGEELEERKANDIFTQTSTSEFMKALRPQADEKISEGQMRWSFILWPEEGTTTESTPTRSLSFKIHCRCHWSQSQK